MKLKRVDYSTLNARQKENFNFQKISAVLADYGFTTMRLSDDWNGADFIALHADGQTVIRIQLKSRCTFQKSYLGKDLFIAFPEKGNWYLFPHDQVLKEALRVLKIGSSDSWSKNRGYSFPHLSKELKRILKPHLISGSAIEISRNSSRPEHPSRR